MTEHLESDMANALDAAYTVARQARVHFGGGPQDLMILEECAEAIEALSALQIAVAKRLNHRGLRGKVDEELADALLTILGAMPAESESWVWLRGKTERLRGVVGEAVICKNPKPERVCARDEWKRLAQERKVLIDRATGALTDSGVAPTYPPEAGILALTSERDQAIRERDEARTECPARKWDEANKLSTWQTIDKLPKVRTRPVVMVGTVGVCFQTCSLPPECPVTAVPSWATHFIFAPEGK